MGRYIAEFGGKFLEWSTVVDAPISYLMDEAELRQYIEDEYGLNGMHDFEQRLARVREKGTSALNGTTKADLLAYNRAGDKEGHVATEEEMVARYTCPAGADVRDA